MGAYRHFMSHSDYYFASCNRPSLLQPLRFVNYISTINTQHTQRPDVSVQQGYIWRHVLAIKWPSSGQQRIVLLNRISPITSLDRPKGFQEVKAPTFRDNGTGWW